MEDQAPAGQPLPDWPRLMSVQLAAAYLSISATSLREHGPAAVRIGRRVLYDRQALDRWADRLSPNYQPASAQELAAQSRDVERRFFERRRLKGEPKTGEP